MGNAYGPWFENQVLKPIVNNPGQSVIRDAGGDTSGRVGINVQAIPKAGHPYLTVNDSVCIGVDNASSMGGLYAENAPNLLVIGKVGIGFANFDPFKSKVNHVFKPGDPELNIGGRCLIRPTPDSSGSVSQDTTNPILRVEQGMIFQVDAPPPAGTATDTKYIVIGTYNNDSFSNGSVAATDHYGIGIQWDGDFARLHLAKASTTNPNGQNDTILCWGSDYNDNFRIRFKGSRSKKARRDQDTRHRHHKP